VDDSWMEERPLVGALVHIKPVRNTKNKMNTTIMLFCRNKRPSGIELFGIQYLRILRKGIRNNCVQYFQYYSQEICVNMQLRWLQNIFKLPSLENHIRTSGTVRSPNFQPLIIISTSVTSVDSENRKLPYLQKYCPHQFAQK